MTAFTDLLLNSKDNPTYHSCQQADFLQEVMESLQDGLLIISEAGELIYANASAHHIFHQLQQDSYEDHKLPQAIWHICELLLVSRNQSLNKVFFLSDEISLNKTKIFRVRVRWLDLTKCKDSGFLVTIENRYESMRNLAIAEVAQYHLTQRETDIWCLYRANYSYKEIAAYLYISINTVKKHMKNIHAKRRQNFLESQFSAGTLYSI
ncbi:helix-turn-helix transcriptional regulator [Pelatocladus sp. BLCC-F211]|uniref:helix-turn-helix transcriptional regulator n=1 Tax=Pelatocladus sp. BLCC-F211 TaxID=3342752 RepID=UPI0035B7F06F